MSEIKVDSIGPRVDSGTLTIGAAGDTVNIAGTAGTGFPAGTTLTGSTNNTVATVTGANALAGEANLTFDGSTFTATGTSSLDGAVVINESGASVDFRVESDAETHMLTVSGANNVVGISESGFFGDLGVGLHIKTNDSGGTVDGGANELVLENGSDTGMTILSGTSGTGSVRFGDSGTNDIGRIVYDHNTNDMIFNANGGERVRIDGPTGNFAIGGAYDTWYKQTIYYDGATGGGLGLNAAGNTNGTRYLQFKLADTQIGDISRNGTGASVSYTTSSDYRLKENVDYNFDATTRIKQLKPARFNWIMDETNTVVDGFLAHEVSSVVPEAINGEKDAMHPEVLYTADDELPEGKNIGDVKEATKINPQGIDQSKLVPLLVKTIQELEARITTLENA